MRRPGEIVLISESGLEATGIPRAILEIVLQSQLIDIQLEPESSVIGRESRNCSFRVGQPTSERNPVTATLQSNRSSVSPFERYICPITVTKNLSKKSGLMRFDNHQVSIGLEKYERRGSGTGENMVGTISTGIRGSWISSSSSLSKHGVERRVRWRDLNSPVGRWSCQGDIGRGRRPDVNRWRRNR